MTTASTETPAQPHPRRLPKWVIAFGAPLAGVGAGLAVLLISTELDEILALSDRIAVMYEGQVIGVVQAKDADVNEIGLMMAGARAQRDQVNG